MNANEWPYVAPVILSFREFHSMSPEQKRLRFLQNRTRVALLHQEHEQRYGLPAMRRAAVHAELALRERRRGGVP